MSVLRQIVAKELVRRHRITPELAAWHAWRMPAKEVKWRFLQYAGVELSAAGETLRAGNEFSARSSRPATMTAGSRHSTLLPKAGQAMPDSETENRAMPEAENIFASGGRLDHPHGAGFAVASRV